jgi:hypothetical protein
VLPRSGAVSTRRLDGIGYRGTWIDVQSPEISRSAATQEVATAAFGGDDGEIFNNGRGFRFFCQAPGGVMFEPNTQAAAGEKNRGTFDN